MGECGCTASGLRYRLDGPPGVIYVLHIYPGCPECQAPPDVTIEKHKDDPRDPYNLTALPELKFGNDYGDFAATSFATLDHNLLLQALISWVKPVAGSYDPAHPEDVLSDAFDECFWNASIKTLRPEGNKP